MILQMHFVKGARTIIDVDIIPRRRFEYQTDRWMKDKYDIFLEQMESQKKQKESNYKFSNVKY